LAALIPQIPKCKEMRASDMPWVKQSQSFFETWEALKGCMPLYDKFIESHSPLGGGIAGGNLQQDVRRMSTKMQGQAMKESTQAALAEFYLAVAVKLRPAEIEGAGSDSKALLQVAQKCAMEDFEPFVDKGRELITDYDPELHKALEETCPLYEVDDGLFWRANFDVVAPAEFHHFLTALGHGSGAQAVPGQAHVKQSDVQAILESAERAIAGGEASAQPSATQPTSVSGRSAALAAAAASALLLAAAVAPSPTAFSR